MQTSIPMLSFGEFCDVLCALMSTLSQLHFCTGMR